MTDDRPSTDGDSSTDRDRNSPAGPFGLTRRRWRYMIGAAIASALTAACAGGYLLTRHRPNDDQALVITDESTETRTEPIAADPAGLGKPIPPDAFTTLDGQTLSLKDLAGSPILLNFWASTCPPCVVEIPMLEQLAQRSVGKMAVIGVNSGESLTAGKKFIASVKATFPQISDQHQDLATQLGVVSLPTTVLVDREGRVVYLAAGALNADKAAELVRTHLQVAL